MQVCKVLTVSGLLLPQIPSVTMFWVFRWERFWPHIIFFTHLPNSWMGTFCPRAFMLNRHCEKWQLQDLLTIGFFVLYSLWFEPNYYSNTVWSCSSDVWTFAVYSESPFYFLRLQKKAHTKHSRVATIKYVCLICGICALPHITCMVLHHTQQCET